MGNHHLVHEEVVGRSDDAQEEACMSTGQGEDSMANLEEGHEAHLLASVTHSSEGRTGMVHDVEVDKETIAIAPPSYAFHYLEWQEHRELDDKLQA